MLKIRDYADEMLTGLDSLEKWPDVVKEAQRGWIGKSEGANITFALADRTSAVEDVIKLDIFTTRPEVIHGVTFIAVSHESVHLLKSLTS